MLRLKFPKKNANFTTTITAARIHFILKNKKHCDVRVSDQLFLGRGIDMHIVMLNIADRNNVAIGQLDFLNFYKAGWKLDTTDDTSSKNAVSRYG